MARKSGPVLELLLPIDRTASERLHRQVERGLREAIRAGRLGAGAPLPSSRVLSRQLGVARSVVVDAYEQLRAEGYLRARAGSGTTVAAPLPALGDAMRPSGARGSPASRPYMFHPGTPDLAAFPARAWTTSLQRALRHSPHAALGYDDPQGSPRLRVALAAYLSRARGALADPERVLICTGTSQGLGLIGRALRAAGARRIAVEDPCWRFHRTVPGHAGLEIVPVPVDGEGIRVRELHRLEVDAVIVTPAHQYPTGTALSAERRAELVEWAVGNEAIVVEDDYDAEYRYDRDPVGALQGLAPDHVIYAGSASKLLAPGLRLGWLLMPDRMVTALTREKLYADLGSDALTQMALADLIETGELDRHLRRTRRS